MQRPGGVTLLAILDFVAAVCLALFALAMVLGMGFLGAMAGGREPGGAVLLAGLGVLGAVVFFVMAAVSAAIGYGMWNLQNWARILSIAFACLAILGGILRMMIGLVHFYPFLLFGSLVRMAIAAVIIWYLFQPHVKSAFGTP
jgi:hypothetical protein